MLPILPQLRNLDESSWPAPHHQAVTRVSNHMIPIKIQCGCGQRYAFDVEPVNGRMPARVACPACGVDGTAAANDLIAQSLRAAGQIGPSPVRVTVAMATAPPPVQSPAPPIAPTLAQYGRAATSTNLVWYQQIWIGLPIGLVAVGGAIGGGCGCMAWAINRTVFKKLRNPVLKYVVTGLISASAVFVWLVVAALFLSLFRRH